MENVSQPTPDGQAGPRPAFSRREFLGGAAALLGTGALLAACGSSSSGSPSSTGVLASAPKRGGTLKIGCTGGTSTDQLNALTESTNPEIVMGPLLYDTLVTLDANAQPSMQLAEEISPNSDATEWTIRVRDGVVFHNGKALTAEDVLYTFTEIITKNWDAAPNYLLIDLKTSKVLDSHTVRFGCHAPFATFVEAMAGINASAIIPTGYDPKSPIGTGPFRYQSFTPSVEGTFTRNPDYWGGAPYLDAIEVIDFADDPSQLNALESGDIDAIAFLEAASIPAARSQGFETLTSPGGYWNPFTMLCDKPPFTDSRVRQAFRLMVDREQMRETVFYGYGAIGNDLFAVWDSEYDHSLPQREQDLDQAKFLLKQAGQENLTITLVTSNVSAGVVESATVLAQQAKGAGVTVNLSEITPTAFFGPDYLHRTFSQDTWSYLPYWPTIAQATLPYSDYNDTHFDNTTYTNLYNQALSTLDATKRKEIAADMQVIQYNEGGYIIPVFVPNLCAFASNVHGLTASETGQPFNGSDFTRAWMS